MGYANAFPLAFYGYHEMAHVSPNMRKYINSQLYEDKV